MNEKVQILQDHYLLGGRSPYPKRASGLHSAEFLSRYGSLSLAARKHRPRASGGGFVEPLRVDFAFRSGVFGDAAGAAGV